MERSDLPRILFESEIILDSATPLKSHRIKYSCFTASQSLIIFGATSGGLYVFNREPFTFSQLLPNKEGVISFVSVSPNENLIAFATLKGVIGILERNEGLGARMINKSTEHCDSEITSLIWSENNCQVFAGDNNGKVSILNVTSVMSKNMFQVPAFTLMQLDSRIVQLSCRSGLLLVSTLTRCYICDTIKEQYKQVGQKLRDGEFGASFVGINDDLKIFCARPGSRLWEVDMDGIVKSTHELKKALAICPATLVSLSKEPNIISSSSTSVWPNQSLNFSKLYAVSEKYLLTFKEDSIYFFNVDKNVNVLFWSNHLTNILDVVCIEDTIYAYLSSGELSVVKIVSLDKCLLRLYYKNLFKICAELCVEFLDQLLNWSKLVYLYHLKELENHLTDMNEIDLCNELKCFFDKLSKIEYEPISRLDSGIFLVDNYHLNSQFIENRTSLYSSHLKSYQKKQLYKKKKRKRSVSLPNNHRKKSSLKNQISISLPNLIESEGYCEHYVLSKIGEKRSKHFANGASAIGSHHLPFPFLTLASPDVIHDALVELGTNVTGKLVGGKKTLHEKWQILEGKLRLLKPESNSEEYGVEDIAYDITDGNNIISDFDENQSIVHRPEKKNLHLPDLSTEKMLKIIEEFDNLFEDDLKTDLAFEFLNESFKLFLDYQSEFKKIRSCTNNNFKSFPFSRYFKEKEVSVIQRIFHEALKSNILVDWFQVSESVHKNLLLEEPKHPGLLKDLHLENDLILDNFVSRMLLIFSEILDPFIILQCLHSASMKCSYESFCTILFRFQDGDYHYITNDEKPSDVSHSEWPLPLLLNTMFLMLRLDQIESSSKMGIEGKVSLCYVAYIILKLEMHLISTSIDREEAKKKCCILFLSYLTKLLVKSYPINLNDETVIVYVLNSFLTVNSRCSFQSCSSCSFPSFGTNLPVMRFAEIGYFVVDYFWNSHLEQSKKYCPPDNELSEAPESSTRVFTELKAVSHDLVGIMKKNNSAKFFKSSITASLKEIINICDHIPRLWKYLLSQNDVILHIPSAVALMIQLNLITKSNNLLTVKNINLFEKVIILNIICKKGICLNCGWKNTLLDFFNYGIPWTELSCIILKYIDSKTAIELLQKYSGEIQSTDLDLSFYQCAIVSALVDAHQTGLRQKVINCVTSLSQGISGIPIFSPDVTCTFDAASRLDCNGDFDILKLDEDSSETHHWGVSIDLVEEVCRLCSLSLGAKALIAANNGGLIAFKCGHTYHAICLKHQNSDVPVCTLCYSS